MRNEGPGAAGMMPSVQPSAPAAGAIKLAQAQGTASDAFVLPSPDKVITLKPVPLGTGHEASAYRLPDGASFDTVRLVTIDGRQVIALVQADGTVLVLEGTGPASGSTAAATSVEYELPNLIVGDIEVPREALAAAFQNNGIQPAAGDAPIVSSGNNFEEPIPDIGPGLDITALLGPTALAFDFPEPGTSLLGPDTLGGLGLAGSPSFGPGSTAPGFTPPGFTGGVVGQPTTPVRDGEGNPVSGELSSGTLSLDQARTPFGTAGDGTSPDVRIIDVRFTTGSEQTTVRFGTTLPVNINTDGKPGADIVWERVGDSEIVGKIAKDADGVKDDVVVRITLVGTTEFAGGSGEHTIQVRVELLDGFADVPGNDRNTFDFGKIELVATSTAGTATGNIEIIVVDDVPQAGFTIGEGEGSGPVTIVHDESADPSDVTLPSAVATPIAALTDGPAHAAIGWTVSNLGSVIDESGANIGADRGPGASIAYTLTQAAGGGFSGQDSGLKASTGGGFQIFLFSETVVVDGQSTTVVVGREGAEGADPAGTVAFVLYVGANKSLYLVQYEAIDHSAAQGGSQDAGSDASEGLSGFLSGADGLLHLTQTVTDSDGDTATATSPVAIAVTFLDDGPTVSTGPGSSLSMGVREDGLGQGVAPGDTTTGNPDAGFPADALGTSDETQGLAGSLGVLFKAGADAPLTFGLTTDIAAMNLPALLSGGTQVVYGLATIGEGETVLEARAGEGGPLVFTFKVNGDGSWSFDLVGQLDHAPGAGANTALQLAGGGTAATIDLSGAITATDKDGDSVAGSAGQFTIAVTDDVPVLTGSGSASVTVHEDGLSADAGDFVTGNAETAADQASTSDEGVLTQAALRALVTAGADGPVTFELNAGASGAVTTAGGTAVTSNGHPLLWGVEGGSVVAYYDAEGGKHVVLAISQGDNGDFDIDLRDRVDHPAGTGDDGTLTLRLNDAFTALDFDKDPVDLSSASITVVVGNDVPVGQADGEASLIGAVEEEALGNFDPETTAGSNGNQDSNDIAGVAPGTQISGAASLTTLFQAGADAPLSIHISGTDVVNETLAHVMSRGEAVEYRVVAGAGGGDELQAFVPASGDGADRMVFTLTVQPGGAWSFTLLDQLDHADGDHENVELVLADGSSVPALDFTAIVTATDADGDVAVLDGTGATFAIQIQDDVPVMASDYAPVTGEVDESALPDANVDSGQPGELPGSGLLTVAGNLSGLVSVGSDEFKDTKGAHFAFATDVSQLDGVMSGGETVSISVEGDTLFATAGGNPVFTVTLSANGAFTFTLQGPIDHAPGGNDETGLVLKLGSLFTATDFDGDSIVLAAGAVAITVQDDIPVGQDGAASISVSVEEEALSNFDGNAGSNGNPDDQDGAPGYPDPQGASADQSQVVTGGLLTSLFKPGADVPVTIGLKDTIGSTDLPGLMSRGEAVSYVVEHQDGQDVLRAFVPAGEEADRDVFTLTVKADGSWTFQLLDQLDHADAAGENFELLSGGGGTSVAGIDFTSILVATDNDGDRTSLDGNGAQFVVAVQDDVPVLAACATPLAFCLDESGLANDQSHGNPDAGRPGETPGNGAVSFTGSIAAFVTVGADEFADTKGAHFFFTPDATIAGLTSRGEAISFVPDGDTSLQAVAEGGRIVFTIQLDATGSFTFTLLDQIDHANGPDATDVENSLSIDLGPLFSAVDADGDTLSLADAPIRVIIQDDIPVLVGAGGHDGDHHGDDHGDDDHEHDDHGGNDHGGNDHEDDDRDEGDNDHHGSSNEDEDEHHGGDGHGQDEAHGSALVSVGEHDAGTDGASRTGSLQGFVKVGADEVLFGDGSTGASFSLKGTAELVDSGFTADGKPVLIEVGDEGLRGYVAGGNDGTTVFTFTVEANGQFAFQLLGHLDHPAGNGENGLCPVIDLSAFVMASDADGDSVTLTPGMVTFQVNDDVPVATGETISLGVFEKGLEDGNHGGDSYATTASGSLQVLVNAGADSTQAGANFSLHMPEDGEDSGLTAGGSPVTIDIVDGVLVGSTCDVKVFTLSVEKDGSYLFTLLQALDHPAAGTDQLSIDLSRYIVAEDTDHDQLSFCSGSFVVGVEDDTPVATCNPVQVAVDESALDNGNPDAPCDTAEVTGNLQALVSVGADDVDGGAVFSLADVQDEPVGLTSGGIPVVVNTVCGVLTATAGGATIFTLSLAADGAFAINLLGPVDHQNELGGAHQDTATLALTRFIVAQDADGDTIALGANAFTLAIRDDIPVAVTECGSFVTATVEESTLGSASSALATGSVAGLFRAGADQNLTVALKSSVLPGDLPSLYSNGVKLGYAMVSGQLVATAASVVIFTLAVQPSGAFTFTLKGPLDHVSGDGANYALVTSAGGKSTVDAIDFSKLLVARDGDTDTVVTSSADSFKIAIHDDVPAFVTADATAKANAASGSTTGDIVFDMGVDKPASSVSFVPGTGPAGVTSGGMAIKYNLSSDGKTLTGYTDVNSNNTVDAGEKAFTATVSTVSGADAYTFQQFKTLDLPGATKTLVLDGSTAYGSGPSQYLALKNGSTDVALLTGYKVDSDYDDAFAASWWKTSAWSQGQSLETKSANGSEAGFGVSNNNLDKGEMIRVDFHDRDFAGPTGFNGPVVKDAAFKLFNFDAHDDTVKYVVYFEDGSKEKGLVTNETFTVQSASGSKPIDYIEFYEEKGSVKFDMVSVNKTETATGSLGLEFDVKKADGDGDTASGRFSVTVTADQIDASAPLQGVAGKNTVIIGGDAGEILTGQSGDDILIGNLGRDTLTGGTGKDTFKLTDLSAKDLIADYNSTEDKIDLTGLFTKASGAPLSDYVSYDKSTGELRVDADGAGAAAAPVAVAIVDAAPAVHPVSVTIVYDDHTHAHQTTNVG